MAPVGWRSRGSRRAAAQRPRHRRLGNSYTGRRCRRTRASPAADCEPCASPLPRHRRSGFSAFVGLSQRRVSAHEQTTIGILGTRSGAGPAGRRHWRGSSGGADRAVLARNAGGARYDLWRVGGSGPTADDPRRGRRRVARHRMRRSLPGRDHAARAAACAARCAAGRATGACAIAFGCCGGGPWLRKRFSTAHAAALPPKCGLKSSGPGSIGP